ncbi:MAG: hypothetical protein QW063_00425 [Candidatus Nanoarchaeia archaeon]
MAEWTLEEILLLLIAIFGFILLAIILGFFKFGKELWYTDCRNVPEGPRCFQLGETVSCIAAENISKDVNIPLAGYYNPLCSIYSDSEYKCIYAFPNLTKNEQAFQVCKFIPASYVVEAPAGKKAGKDSLCLLNAQIDCADLSQKTSPKCQEVLGCKPVNAIEAAFERLKPPS